MKPKIVCLSGSVRFPEDFAYWRRILSIAGYIVVGPEFSIPKEQADNPSSIWYPIKQKLDELHLRKIDLADEVMVLNVGGYIGESTRNEIKYAQEHNKVIKYLEEPK